MLQIKWRSNFNNSKNLRTSTRSFTTHFSKFSPSEEQVKKFHSDGFLIVPHFISKQLADRLIERVDPLFHGQFETGHFPDEWHWRKGISFPDVTREICNAWKSDLTIASVVLSSQIGKVICSLTNWSGARIAQDDIWAKPPGGGKPIEYHTDTSYIPWNEVTCWIALDDVSSATGTLEYVKGSHRWTKYKNKRNSSTFHSSTNYKSSLIQAAQEEGIDPNRLDELIVKVEVPAGGCSFHNGNIWHGSNINTSSTWRRSIGIHLIPSDSSFEGKNVGYIYGRYKQFESDKMDETFFPIVYSKNGYRSPFLGSFCQDALISSVAHTVKN